MVREYGIPAVLGSGVATKCIHNGSAITWKVILEWQFAGKTEVRGGKPIQHIFTERPVPVLSGLMLAIMYPYSFHRGVGIHATHGDEG